MIWGDQNFIHSTYLERPKFRKQISGQAVVETDIFGILPPPEPNMTVIFEIMISPDHFFIYSKLWIILNFGNPISDLSKILKDWKDFMYIFPRKGPNI